MKFSISLKIIATALIIMFFSLLFVSFFNYKNSAKTTKELFQTIQNEALIASYNTINITFNARIYETNTLYY